MQNKNEFENKETKEYGLQEIHSELLEIMTYIHHICKANSIDYSLTGGSLLGAIRHDGFIPWDDDFDIMFDRPNYEKFIQIMKHTKENSFLLERDQWVYRIRKHSKVKGYVPSVDLFVVDRLPQNKITYNFQKLSLKVIQGMLRENEMDREYSFFYSFCIKATERMGSLFNKEKMFESYDRISRAGNKRGRDKLGILNDRFRLIGYQYNDNLMKHYETHKFEDQEFSIISRYDDYLTKQFGDYMQLPPEEDRVPQHIF